MLHLLKKKGDNESSRPKQQAVVLPLNAPNRSLEFLTELIDKVRPDHTKDFAQAELRFKALLYQVSNDKSSLFSLRKALLTQFLKNQHRSCLNGKRHRKQPWIYTGANRKT